MVVRTEPEPFAEVTDLGRAIRFHFDERISEQVQGSRLEDAVTVSPRGGEVSVSHGSRSISVSVEGGLRPGVVYRVTLLPAIRDLFGNQLRDPFELVFSTGAEAEPTTVAGEVWDRVSGQAVRDALVHAVGADSLVHVARTDDQGVFALRYVPSGALEVTSFLDQDRDGEVGERETKGSLAVSVAPGDTLIVDLAVLAPDTSAAVLARASALDSATTVLEFDDWLSPGADVAGIEVTLARDGGAAPGVARLFHEHEYQELVTRVTDSLAAAAPQEPSGPPRPQPTAPDSSAAPPDSVAAGLPDAGPTAAPGQAGTRAVGPPSLPGTRARGSTPSRPGRVLPGRRLVVRLDAPLEVEVEYRVLVGGVVNLNGLGGGGGEAVLRRVAAPDPEPAVEPDPTAPPPDSAAAGAGAPGGDRR